jgi:hypothetical protein
MECLTIASKAYPGIDWLEIDFWLEFHNDVLKFRVM